MRNSHKISAARILAVLPLALACSYPPQLKTNNSVLSIIKRDIQAGGKCGSNGGNAACAPGLCCSAESICGIGGYFCVSPACQINFGPSCDGNTSPSGQDTSGTPRPQFGSVPYGVDVSRCTVPGKVALTFDDGPNRFTSELLDILKKNNAKATFFVVGVNSGKGQIQDASTGYPEIIKRMHAEGHQIGSHSWSHEDFTQVSSQQRRDQIVKNEIALADILGFFPTYLRPPFTSWNDEVIADFKKFGYHNINFDLDTQDWKEDDQVSRKSFSDPVSQNTPASKSFIAVAHDIHEYTVHGYAQYMIDEAKKYGYELVTVGECLGDPSGYWYRDPKSGEPLGGLLPAPVPTKAAVPGRVSPTTESGFGVATTLPVTGSSVGITVTSGSKTSGSTAGSSTAPAAAATTTKSSGANYNKLEGTLGISMVVLALLAGL